MRQDKKSRILRLDFLFKRFLHESVPGLSVSSTCPPADQTQKFLASPNRIALVNRFCEGRTHTGTSLAIAMLLMSSKAGSFDVPYEVMPKSNRNVASLGSQARFFTQAWLRCCAVSGDGQI